MVIVLSSATPAADPDELQKLRDELTKMQSMGASFLSTATAAKKRLDKLTPPA